MTDQTPTKKRIRLVVALVVGFLFAALLLILAFAEVPVGNQAVLQVTAGSLGAAFSMIVSFYFGDSDGRQESSGSN